MLAEEWKFSRQKVTKFWPDDQFFYRLILLPVFFFFTDKVSELLLICKLIKTWNLRYFGSISYVWQFFFKFKHMRELKIAMALFWDWLKMYLVMFN